VFTIGNKNCVLNCEESCMIDVSHVYMMIGI